MGKEKRLMSAEEANIETKNNIEDIVKQEIRDARESIKNASEKGVFSTMIGCKNESTITMLKSLGYRILRSFETINIDWKSETIGLESDKIVGIHQLKNELGLEKYENGNALCGYGYKGVLSIGNFDALDDQKTGLVTMKIKNDEFVDYNLVLTITTIDGDVWQGYANDEVDIDHIFRKFNETYGSKLPTEDELNEFLKNYGIFGSCKG